MHSVLVSLLFDAPAPRVWELLREPGSVQAWHPAVLDSEATALGRDLVLTNGERIRERIDFIDDEHRAFGTTTFQSPMAFHRLQGTLRVWPQGPRRSLVEFCGFFEAAPETAAETLSLVRDFHLAGLGALRTKLAKDATAPVRIALPATLAAAG
ncbi:MAG: SRPBCC family protein [Holophagaceae bacterium]|nr:SRPBCC family protein [Holophagaceae bacterium]